MKVASNADTEAWLRCSNYFDHSSVVVSLVEVYKHEPCTDSSLIQSDWCSLCQMMEVHNAASLNLNINVVP